MEIKEGYYVRTKEGKIYQILDEEIDIKFRFDMGIDVPFYRNGKYENQIIKVSENIIELLEIGDYVNGYEIENIYKEIVYATTFEYCDICNDFEKIKIYKSNIKSVVTKEQFNSVKYDVEGKYDSKRNV